jgi:transcriptional regulator with XRE-family HTH domain
MSSALKSYLDAERGRATRLAETLDISRGYLSELAAGKKVAALPVYRRIAEETGIPLGTLLGATGFAEGTVLPVLVPRGDNRLLDLAHQMAPQLRKPAFLRLATDAHAFGLCAGDLIVIDLAPPAGRIPPGALVVAQITDDRGEATTLVGRLAAPWLIGPGGTVLGRQDDTAAVMGTVEAVLRGAGVEAMLKAAPQVY